MRGRTVAILSDADGFDEPLRSDRRLRKSRVADQKPVVTVGVGFRKIGQHRMADIEAAVFKFSHEHDGVKDAERKHGRPSCTGTRSPADIVLRAPGKVFGILEADLKDHVDVQNLQVRLCDSHGVPLCVEDQRTGSNSEPRVTRTEINRAL